MTVDPKRLCRALSLSATEIEPKKWRVTGGREPHVVDRWGCDCFDFRIGGHLCKHRLAAHLHAALRPEVLAGLRSLAAASPPATDREPGWH